MGAGNKTASWPSANYTSAQRTACFLFTLVTAICCVLLSIHLCIHPLALNENTLVFLILWDYISSTNAQTQTQQMSSSLFCGHMSTCVCVHKHEKSMFLKDLMQKLQLCISLPVLFHFIPLCPSSRFDDLVYCLLTGFCAFIQKVQLSGWKLFIARAIK